MHMLAMTSPAASSTTLDISISIGPSMASFRSWLGAAVCFLAWLLAHRHGDARSLCCGMPAFVGLRRLALPEAHVTLQMLRFSVGWAAPSFVALVLAALYLWPLGVAEESCIRTLAIVVGMHAGHLCLALTASLTWALRSRLRFFGTLVGMFFCAADFVLCFKPHLRCIVLRVPQFGRELDEVGTIASHVKESTSISCFTSRCICSQ